MFLRTTHDLLREGRVDGDRCDGLDRKAERVPNLKGTVTPKRLSKR
jgi:hypothetical protein